MKSVIAIMLIVAGSVPLLRAHPEEGALCNASMRALAGTGVESAITGFVISGSARSVLVRVVGPSLSIYGVKNYAVRPTFVVYDSLGQAVGSGRAMRTLDGNWERPHIVGIMNRSGAFALPGDSDDAFAYLYLQPGAYTVVAQSGGANVGVVLTEVYLDPEPKLD